MLQKYFERVYKMDSVFYKHFNNSGDAIIKSADVFTVVMLVFWLNSLHASLSVPLLAAVGANFYWLNSFWGRARSTGWAGADFQYKKNTVVSYIFFVIAMAHSYKYFFGIQVGVVFYAIMFGVYGYFIYLYYKTVYFDNHGKKRRTAADIVEEIIDKIDGE